MAATILLAARTQIALSILKRVAHQRGLHIPQHISEWSKDTVQFFRGEYTFRRTPQPLECEDCGVSRRSSRYKRFHWHHLDDSLKTKMDEAKRKCYENAGSGAAWLFLYEEFANRVADYYLVPVSETAYLCPKCHRRRHSTTKEDNR
jgi:hypothetical protein